MSIDVILTALAAGVVGGILGLLAMCYVYDWACGPHRKRPAR